MNTYVLALVVHSWLRWAALGLGIASTFAAINARDAAAVSRADRLGLFLMMALDTQMLIGLVLYLVLSPLTTAALLDFGAAMRTPSLRFWAVDHAATMFVAVIVMHVGRVMTRKAVTPEAKRSRLLISAGVATFLMLIAIPWPGLPNGRPLFRIG